MKKVIAQKMVQTKNKTKQLIKYSTGYKTEQKKENLDYYGPQEK